MVAMTCAPCARSCSITDTASAAPSAGSVPAPSSSINTSVRGPRLVQNPGDVRMWPEKVDRLCSMLCSSPMSTRISSYTHTSLDSCAGRRYPKRAIVHKSPAVFSVTVLPPVFGPVITSVSYSPPSAMSTGTTASGAISGWRARAPAKKPQPSRTCGRMAFSSSASFALASSTSNFSMAS